MKKTEFIEELKKRLSGLPPKDIEEKTAFFSEAIDDRIEEGLGEEEAVSQMGTPESVVSQILADYPLTKLVNEKIRPKRRMKAWEIICLIIGSPLWITLFAVLFAVFIAVYVCIWAVIIALWAVVVAFVCSTLGCVCETVILVIGGKGLGALAAFGIALLFAGLSLLLIIVTKTVTGLILKLSKKIALLIKSAFVGKGKAK